VTPIEKQFASLKEKFPNAVLSSPDGNGVQLVTIPDVELPPGWSRPKVHVYFVLPVGYPAAQPDTFWTSTLTLQNGSMPQATNTSNTAVGVPAGSTWFSWHPQRWNPNTDSILNYMRMIRKRLEAVQ